MASNGSNRIRKADFEKTLSRKTRDQLRIKIKEIEKSREGLTSFFLNNVLENTPHFLGVYPQDFLLTFSPDTYPIKLLLNLDVSSQPGTHWLSLCITETHLEIFDSFGLDPKTWNRKPVILLKFIEKLSQSRNVLISPRFQSNNSNLCGFYSILFLSLRTNFTFHEICNLFSQNLRLNDTVLSSFLQ